jgi:dipeptidase E
MRKIVAIGGGEIGRPKAEGGHYPIETRAIDEEIIRLTGKRHPKVLLIPTASGDASTYYPTFEKYYGKILGCKTDVLYLVKENPSRAEIRKKILSADIVYVGGGNTLKMLKRWKKAGVEKILKEAWEKGIVLSGVSAGAVCWFDYAHSDSWKMSNPDAPYIRIAGLGFVKGICYPHFSQKERKHDVPKFVRKHGGIGVAIDDCCAIEVMGDKYKVLQSKKSAHAYKVYRSRGKPVIEWLPSGKYLPLSELLSR